MEIKHSGLIIMKYIAIFTALLMMLSLPAVAQDWEKGLAASQTGDYATAFKEWKPLAEQGYPKVQHNLGYLYMNGLGVTQDYKKAIKWFKLSAEQGFVESQQNLGVMYMRGLGVPKIIKKR